MFMHYIINILILARWADRANSFIFVCLGWLKQKKTNIKRREGKKLSITFKPTYRYAKNEDIRGIPGRSDSLLL